MLFHLAALRDCVGIIAPIVTLAVSEVQTRVGSFSTAPSEARGCGRHAQQNTGDDQGELRVYPIGTGANWQLELDTNPTRTLAHLLRQYSRDELTHLRADDFFMANAALEGTGPSLDQRDNMVLARHFPLHTRSGMPSLEISSVLMKLPSSGGGGEHHPVSFAPTMDGGIRFATVAAGSGFHERDAALLSATCHLTSRCSSRKDTARA